MAVTTTALVGVAAASSYKANQEADIARRRQASATRKANEVNRRISELQNTRERKRAANAALLAESSNIASGASSGALGSSSLSGSNVSISSNFGSAISAQNTLLAGNNLSARYLQQGQDAYNKGMTKAGNWQAVGSLAQQGASIVGV